MSSPRKTRLRRAFALSAFAPLAAAACADGTGPVPAAPIEATQRAVLQCEARVAEQTVSCSAPGAEGGARMNVMMGGQGMYVRMTSTGVSYNAGTQLFSFDATVQNLTTLPLATTDGATRHSDGVRVFLSSGPTVVSGAGSAAVLNATGTAVFTAANQPYFQYGGQIGGVDQPELGADGLLATAEVSSAKNWQFQVAPTVNSFVFVVYVSTESPGATATAAPQVTAISPATLVPGQSATLTGYNFNLTPGNNAVSIGGRAATVTGGNATQLFVTVPCTGSGSVAVNVTQGGMRGRDRAHPLQVTQLDVPLGSAVVRTTAADSHCNELTSAGGNARYIVAVFNSSTAVGSAVGAQFSGDLEGAAPALAAAAPRARLLEAPVLSLEQQMEAARARVADERHYRILEANRAEHERLRARFAGDPRLRPSSVAIHRDPVEPPLTRTFKVPNINSASFCTNYYVASATRVYYNGKIAIYEDDATLAGLKVGASPTMQDYYNRIGDQFNADMEPVISTNFGNVLARDPITDNNGVLIAFFTPIINTNFSGVAGFVASCDQYPDADAAEPAVGGPYVGTAGQNGGSNFGEVFYAYQPTSTGTGFGTVGTPDYWYRTVRSTFIHETKHVVSMASRTTNGAPLEQSWLEEGTARHSEELWMRNAVDNVAWKGNTGYGSALNPINLYCDARTTGACANTRRPAAIMQRHFFSLYTQMTSTNGAIISPFGRTPYDNASYFYAISWSLVRYGIDRYGASDAAFLTALTNSTTTGTTNLAARTGVSTDQLMGGWALSLAADDYPGLAAPSLDIQMPTWNFRDIYAGINTDGFSPLAYPLAPTALSFGSFAPTNVAEIYGGGVRWFQISGDQQAPQLLRLLGAGGGSLPSTLRIAVTRVE